jgi:hypothetical protein
MPPVRHSNAELARNEHRALPDVQGVIDGPSAGQCDFWFSIFGAASPPHIRYSTWSGRFFGTFATQRSEIRSASTLHKRPLSVTVDNSEPPQAITGSIRRSGQSWHSVGRPDLWVAATVSPQATWAYS